MHRYDEKEWKETEAEIRASCSGFDSKGRHLAPNGQPSNLSYIDWVTVRTPSFLRWFGNWIKAARIKHLLASEPMDISRNTVRDSAAAKETYNGIGIVRNKEISMDVEFVRTTLGKVMRHEPYDHRTIGALKKLFENAVFMFAEAPDFKTPRKDGTLHKDSSSNVESFSHFVNRFRMDRKDYLIRYSVRDLRTRRPDGYHQLHSQHISEIKSSSLSTRSALFVRGAETTASDSKLASFLISVNDNTSKVVDDNSEPLKVFLCTPESFPESDSGNCTYYCFTKNREDAGKSGKGCASEAFLNIRNSYHARTSYDMGSPLLTDSDRLIASTGYDGLFIDHAGWYIAFKAEEVLLKPLRSHRFSPST